MGAGIQPLGVYRDPHLGTPYPGTASRSSITCIRENNLVMSTQPLLMPTLVSRMARHPGMNLSDPGISMPVTLLREAISERPSRRAYLDRTHIGLSHFTFISPCLDPIGGHPPDISPRSCRGPASQMKGLGSFLHTENSFSTTDTDFSTSMPAGYLSWLSLRQVTSL